MSAKQDLFEIVLDALTESDGGNNPFYADDDDTKEFAEEITDAIIAAGWPRKDTE